MSITAVIAGAAIWTAAIRAALWTWKMRYELETRPHPHRKDTP